MTPWPGSTAARPENAPPFMKYPSRQDIQRFFRRLPWWVVPLILLLLFGRFILLLFFHA